MRRLLIVVGLLGVLLAVGAALLEHGLTRLVHDELLASGAGASVRFRELQLLGLQRMRALDVELVDPLTGHVVGRVETLDVELDLGWEEERKLRLDRFTGRRGEAVFVRDEQGYGLVRAIAALLASLRTGDGTSGEVPTFVFQEMEFVVGAPGVPLERLADCELEVGGAPGEVRISVQAGASGGRATALVGPRGLVALELQDFRVTPTLAGLPPGIGDRLGPDLAPSGRLDLRLETDEQGTVRTQGLLREGGLASERLPFPLAGLTVPFSTDGDRLLIEQARLAFEGGRMSFDVDYAPAALEATVDLVDAEFTARLLELVPGWQGVRFVRCEDGGAFELHVDIERHGDDAPTRVRASGGLLVERVFLGPDAAQGGVGVPVEDVVGRFEATDATLRLTDISGRVAGGLVGLSGTLGLQDDDFVLDAQVSDVDVARVEDLLRAQGLYLSDVSGWLQGRVAVSGVLGDRRALAGTGQASIRGGNVWSMKIFDRLLKALQLVAPGGSEKHRLDLAFELGQGRVTFPKDGLVLRSDFLSLRGEGRISSRGGLRLDITPLPGFMGPIGDVARFLQEQLVAIKVEGTLHDPRVVVQPVQIVTGPLGKVWDAISRPFREDDEPPSQP